MAQQTFHRTETAKGRRVTAQDGEVVVTADGIRHAARGDYVLATDRGDEVLTPDQFAEKGWEVKAKKSAKKSAKSPALKKATEPKPSPVENLSPAERVRRAKAQAGKR